MDEVRIERLFKDHGRNCLLVLIRDWPESGRYKSKPNLVASLEYLVNILIIQSTNEKQCLYM